MSPGIALDGCTCGRRCKANSAEDAGLPPDIPFVHFSSRLSSKKAPSKEEVLKEHALEHNARAEHDQKQLVQDATNGRSGFPGMGINAADH